MFGQLNLANDGKYAASGFIDINKLSLALNLILFHEHQDIKPDITTLFTFT